MQEKKILYCYGCCNAKSYNMQGLFDYFSSQNITPRKIDEAMYVCAPFKKDFLELFYFQFGSVVIWDANSQQQTAILNIFNDHIKEKLSLITKKTLYESESIKCVHSPEANKDALDEANDLIVIKNNDIWAKLAISYALAQSVKLSSLENSVEVLLRSTMPIQQELASKGSISLSKRQISKKIGVLFQERYSVNIHSDVLDIPDIFWKMHTYEPLYLLAAKLQDIQSRQNILNKRLNMLSDLYGILTNELNAKHSNRLETVIIVLIAIEAILGLLMKVH